MQSPLPIASTSESKASHSVATSYASASLPDPKAVAVASQSVPKLGPLASPFHFSFQSVSVASQPVPLASDSTPISAPVSSSHSALQAAHQAKISHLSGKQIISKSKIKNKDKKLGSSTDFKCDECGLSYMSTKTLNRHKKEKHFCTTSSGSQSCLESGCSFSSFHMQQLRDHLEKSHSIDMKICTKKFDSNQGMFLFTVCSVIFF